MLNVFDPDEYEFFFGSDYDDTEYVFGEDDDRYYDSLLDDEEDEGTIFDEY